MFLFRLLFLTFIGDFVCAQCPPKQATPNCDCSTIDGEAEKLYVTCSGVKLLDFASMFRGLGPLDVTLQNGSFANLDNQFFTTMNLGKLKLINNGLERILVGDFRGNSPSLREVYLSEPGLRLVDDLALNDISAIQRFTLSDSAVLERFPKLKGLPSVTFVAFTNNSVRFLEAGTLAELPALQEIDFRGNKIEIFDISTFGELDGVRKLDLTGNAIYDLSFMPLVLRNLPNLNYLFLQSNKISKIPLGFFDGSNSILTVDFSKNEINKLPDAVSSNASSTLRELYLGNNYITELPSGFFEHIPNLRTLSLANNSIKVLDTQLAPLKDLLYLRLEGNKLQRITSDAFVTLARLQSLTLQGNQLTVLENGVFSGMDGLLSLDLSQNLIQEFHGTEIRNLTTLETLLFGGNKLRNLYAGFESLTSLKRLDLSNNQISNIDSNTFVNLTSLENLQLDGNLFMKVPVNAVSRLPVLERLSLANNRLYQLPELPAIGHLKFLFLDHNSIPQINTGTFQNLPELRQLLLNDNRIITVAEGSFKNLYTLYVLDLSGNIIQSIPEKVFDNLLALETLNLAGNDLSALQAGTLGNLPNVRSVDFSHNVIATVADTAFQNVPRITQFDISRNGLNVIPAAISHLGKVRRLDLSSNRIRQVQAGAFTALEKLENLNLQRNPICFLCEKVFTGSAGLSYLDLSQTDLHHLAQNAFLPNQDFTNILLNGVTLDCDCNSTWLRTLTPNVRCRFPTAVSQMKISQINPEFMTCPAADQVVVEECKDLPVYIRPGKGGSSTGSALLPVGVTPPSSPDTQLQILAQGSMTQAWPSKTEMEAKAQEMDAIEAARQTAGSSGSATWSAGCFALVCLIALSNVRLT